MQADTALTTLVANHPNIEFLVNAILNNHVLLAYAIVFAWCILEGELALILAGILAHIGHVDLFMVTFIAGLGAFCGDQIYFYIGRYGKRFIGKRLSKQRRKFAVAHLLLQRLGWPVIFIQRYMYGFRTIIPISIGITRYNAKKFAIINLFSAWAWAAITIILAWYFGESIIAIIDMIAEHWYLALPVILLIVAGFLYTIKRIEHSVVNKKKGKV
ncbi:DedA family protein [Campylobacter sp. 19-13652]|uniref:DedA family protein n=1 Tax=Campylobacter sp. 19-13652 TaxID=2840180 RepID=UPI001C765D4C|nr:DedA family protein [Campylobacter sp. 19-13652]BCX79100.1 membrane protein [Campylobacter sp. 19-13652]